MYKSGYIKHRNKKIPIIWDGEHAQHIAENFIYDKSIHPLLHVKIQQISKNIKEWKKVKNTKRRFFGVYKQSDKVRYLVIVEISNKFASIITCYKK